MAPSVVVTEKLNNEPVEGVHITNESMQDMFNAVRKSEEPEVLIRKEGAPKEVWKTIYDNAKARGIDTTPMVEKAIAEGKQIPLEILKDHPDIIEQKLDFRPPPKPEGLPPELTDAARKNVAEATAPEQPGNLLRSMEKEQVEVKALEDHPNMKNLDEKELGEIDVHDVEIKKTQQMKELIADAVACRRVLK